MILAVYLLVVVPLVGMATAAVWVPRPWQAVLLYTGPILTALAVAGVPGIELLGWIAVLGIPYCYLVVLPALPWRRGWARWAIPATVLVIVALFVGLNDADVAVVFYLGLPVVVALGALVVAALSRQDRRSGKGVVGG